MQAVLIVSIIIFVILLFLVERTKRSDIEFQLKTIKRIISNNSYPNAERKLSHLKDYIKYFEQIDKGGDK